MRAIAPLEELARKWRRAAPYNLAVVKTVIEQAAIELEALLPVIASRFEALEAQVEAARKVSNAVLSVKEADEGVLQSRICRLEAEIAALKEQHRVECDRQTSHWVWIVKEQGEQLHLERAAALREAAAIITKYFDAQEHYLPVRRLFGRCHNEVLAVLSDSDGSALEAFKAEVRDRALEEAAHSWDTHTIPSTFHDIYTAIQAHILNLRGSK